MARLSLTSIKEMAETEFEPFLQTIHDDYPELVLKYQINSNMKADFIEAVLRQVWVQQPYDKEDILNFMTNRGQR